MKDNKLIAEFMGMTAHHQDKGCMIFMTPQGHNDIVYVTDLEYHKKWNWLMPVVRKCKESVSYEDSILYHNIEDALLSRIDRDDTYRAVVEFINEYNRTNGNNND